MFESLKGIQKGRNIQQRAETTLEKLLEIEAEVRQEYVGRVRDNREIDHNNIYLSLYESLSPTLPDYTEQDLQSLLLTKANNHYHDNEAQVLGLYTGVLLYVLTERYEKEGKKAVYSFDLSGNEFNYLFLFAKRAGELTVRNVKGKYTCAFIASYGGKAEKLLLEGNEGDWATSWAGSEGGNVGTLVIKDNEGNNVASWAGSFGGNVGTLLIKDNEMNMAASWVGSYGVKVGTLALYNAGKNAGYNANATRIIRGKKALALYKRLEKEFPCLRT